MIRFFILALLVPVSFLTACAKPVQELSGIIVYGHETRTIRLCGDSQVFWLHVAQEEQRQLSLKARSLTRYPYQELYLEFTGSILDKAPGEFAKEYPGSVKVDHVRSLSAMIPENCNRLKSVP